MRFSPDAVVFRVRLHLERVHTAEAALRAWLPLVSELRPVSAKFEEADPSGLRRGFLADLLVVLPLTQDRAADSGTVRDRLLASVDVLARRLGLDPTAFEVDEDGTGGVLSVKDPTDTEDTTEGGSGTTHGAYLILALTGADPLNPEGSETDYEDTGEDLL